MGEKEYKMFMKDSAEKYAKAKKMSEEMAKQSCKRSSTVMEAFF